ncbi:TolB family protein [Chondromyces apiculatus]|uniref:Cytochrome c domain-containing protein n=1 Tax=Chondromyces apiculatus DSM 436 TaxID=1192034 RepID=A0A017TID0_9BACT|nr:hypothetical protein [Chondromyces apiculatus]EYF08386.1 Hypothetical protein CAP_3915 [Chondromyces apiculatus DSM 436]
MRSSPRLGLTLLAAIAGSTALGLFGSAACSGGGEASSDTSNNTTSSNTNAGGSGGTGGNGGVGGNGGSSGTVIPPPPPAFPADPQIEDVLPDDTADVFNSMPGTDSGGPCVSEPTMDALVPRNWTPLRFEWTPPPGHNVIELRLKVDNQENDLVVYTSQPLYTIPREMWASLTQNSGGHDVEVQVRSAQIENGALVSPPMVGTSGVVHLAPVEAPGSIVYWSSSAGTAFRGFTVGDEQVTTVITPGQVSSDTGCVSCHSSSPDGKLVFFTRDLTPSGARAVSARSADGMSTVPPANVVSQVALDLLARVTQGAPVLSGAHYSATDSVAISVYYGVETANRGELAWTNLHAADPASGWGILARNGDPRTAVSPTWWHDGTTIAYVSAPSSHSGVVSSVTPEDPNLDIYTVPFNNRQGGNATPLAGASDPGFLEFYPVISPEDRFLAFNRIAQGTGANSYNQPGAEVMVVPAGGGDAVRIEGNDPPACVGKPSPGITNSWPRWAPSVGTANGKNYYWLTYSSTRRPANNPQLYVAGVVTSMVNGVETLERTFPAVYVTTQPPEENNHTPAWDVFQIPEPQ